MTLGRLGGDAELLEGRAAEGEGHSKVSRSWIVDAGVHQLEACMRS